jgi:basic membrane protein A and related proteins
MILQNTDVLYAVAGYTGVGVLEEAQRQGKYAIGVDTDQYTIAEKAIITSMTKNIDITLFNYIENYLENEPSEQLIIEAGIAENGVGLAPIRILSNANTLEKQIEEAKANLK